MRKERYRKTKRRIMKSITAVTVCLAMLSTAIGLGEGMEYVYDANAAVEDSVGADYTDVSGVGVVSTDDTLQNPYADMTDEEMIEMIEAEGPHIEAGPVEEKELEEFADEVMGLCGTVDEDMFSDIVLEAGMNTYKKDGRTESCNTESKILVIDDEYLVPESICRDIFAYDEECLENIEEYVVTEEDMIELEADVESEEEKTMFATLQQGGERYIYLFDMAIENTYEITYSEDKVLLTSPYQTGRLIVKSEQSVADPNATDIVSGYGDLHVLQYETPEEAMDACMQFENMDGVEYAEPDRIVRTMDVEENLNEAENISVLSNVSEEATCILTEETTKSEYLSWGAERIGVDAFKQNVVSSGAIVTDVVVAVIDSGIDYEHEMFEGRITEVGYNFVADEVSGDAIPQDDHNHGTHVSGIIAEMTEQNVKIMPIKVLNKNGGGTELQIYMGIKAAVQEHVDVINMSLGGAGSLQSFEDAIDEAVSQGSVVVVAAGNDTDDANYYTPANVKSAITVSATTDTDELASFSNYGSVIDISAPGQNIVSACNGGGLIAYSGTSMASPCVAGVVAWLKSVNKNCNSDFALEVMKQSSVDLGVPGYDEDFGHGRVDMRGLEVYDSITTCPEFSKEAGNYEEAIELTISCKEVGTDIYYTLDGTIPTKENGKLYNDGEKIVIKQATRVKAVAYKEGKYRSRIVEGIYTIKQEDIPGAYVVIDGVLVEYKGVLSDVFIPDVVSGEAIVAIGAGAFEGNHSIKNVILNDSLKRIEANAFYMCYNLEYISGKAKITEIGDSAFAKCSHLQRLNIDLNSVVKIGTSSFYQCNKLCGKLQFDSLQELGISAFEECKRLEEIELGDCLTEGKNFTFRGCKSLNIVVARGLEIIGMQMFISCENLETLVITEEKVKIIEDFAFADCMSLMGYFNFSNLEKIDQWAFRSCNRLQGVCLSEHIVELYYSVFDMCVNLEYIKAPGVTSVWTNAFRHAGLYTGTECYVELPWEKITYIGEEAFEYVYIENLELSSLTSMGKEAFKGCLFLHSVSMPLLEQVPDKAFEDCNGLKHINIMNAKSIGIGAFDKLESKWHAYGVGYYDGAFLGWIYYNLCELTNENLHIYVSDKLESIGSDNFNLSYECVDVERFEINTFIHAPADSYAIQYAKENNLNQIGDFYIELVEDTYSYTGQVVKPNIIVAFDETKEILLSEGIDYDILADGNVYPGEVSATVTGAGIYFGSVEQQYTIEPIEVTGVSVKGYEGIYDIISHKAVDVTGYPVGACIEYSYSEDSGMIWSDWCAECPCIKDAGEILVKVKISEEYYQTYISEPVKAKVSKRNLQDENVSVRIVEKQQEYTGRYIKPVIEVVWHCSNGTDIVLEDNKDYKVVYSGNLLAGNASALIFAIDGNYIGAWSEEFEILQATNEWIEELAIADWIYGEFAKFPTAKAKFGDVEFSYSNSESGVFTNEVPTTAGTWYVKAEIEETDNYGGLSMVQPFTIAQKILNITMKDETIESSENAEFNYTVKGLVGDDELSEVEVVVRDCAGNVTDNYNEPGVYTIELGSYVLDNEACYDVNVVSATLTVEALEVVTPEPTPTPTPQPKEMANVIVEPYSGVYDSTVHNAVVIEGIPSDITETADITYAYRKNSQAEWSEWTGTIPVIENVGSLYVKVRIECECYETYTSETVKAEVEKKSLADSDIEIIVTPEESAYTGKTIKPQVEVIYSQTGVTPVILEQGEDYRVVYADNVDVGEAGAVILALSSNYDGFVSKGYVITQATNEWTEELTISDWTYGEWAKTPTAKAKFGNVEFSYSDSEDGVFTNEVPATAGTWYVKAEVKGNNNYTGITQVKEFKIEPRDCTMYVQDIEIVKNQVPILKYGVSVGDGGLLPNDGLSEVQLVVKDSNGYEVTDYSQPGVYTITVKQYSLENADSYNMIIQEGTLTIKEWCSVHHYTSKISKSPSYTEEGEVTYTCTECGHSYTESLDMIVMPIVTESPVPSVEPVVTETPLPSEEPITTETPTPTTEPTPTPVVDIKAGDVNVNGVVNLEDATIALMAALGIGDALTGDALIAADVDLSGKVTLNDASLILQMALGIKVELPEPVIAHISDVKKMKYA